MEPRIQYAKTSDGVNIAYWVIGDGPPLVIPPFLFNHVQIEWQMPARISAYEHLASRATVVHYDCRGLGMSDRDAVDFSVEAAIRDLQAVVERAGLERFALHSLGMTGEMPFAYAARFPERITHLVHRSAGPTSLTGRWVQIIQPLADEDWEMYTEMFARAFAGWTNPQAASFAALIRASHSPASLDLAISAISAAIASDGSRETLAAAVSAPTLILHMLGDAGAADAARRLASNMPNAHVVGSQARSLVHFRPKPDSMRYSSSSTPPLPRLALRPSTPAPCVPFSSQTSWDTRR